MKTAVTMVRLFKNNDIVRQDSKTTFFNANDLLDIYNKNADSKKRMDKFFELKSTKEYIQTIAADIATSKDTDATTGVKSNTPKTGYLISPEVYITKRGSKNGGTWMHPFLFVDFAMWLSPEFKLTAAKWIYDKLISFRLEAGDTYKDVSAALFMKNPSTSHRGYSDEAKMINKLVFGDPSGNQRNGATEEQLKLLAFMQKADVKLISNGLDFYDRYQKLVELKEYS